MNPLAKFLRALSTRKGPSFFIPGIIIVTLAGAFTVSFAADTLSLYNGEVHVYSYGGPTGQLFAEGHDENNIAPPTFTEFHDMYNAYEAAYLNPYLITRYKNKDGAQQDGRLPYVVANAGFAAYDSVVLVFNLDSLPDNPRVFHQHGDAWQPLASVMDDSGALRARISDNGFFAVMGDASEAFDFDEYFSSYPNPFAPRAGDATITYLLAGDADVEIRIFSRTGAPVRTLSFSAGDPGGRGSANGYYLNRVTWDGRNEQGRLVEPGGYRCRLIVKDQYSLTWKIGVMR